MCVKPPMKVGGFFIEKITDSANIIGIRRLYEETIYVVIR